MTRQLLISLTALALVGMAAASMPSVAANPWDVYNLAPTTRTLAPIAVYKTSGTVTNPNNVLSGGATRLSGSGSLITLDFGKEVGGIVTLTLSGASSSSESLGLAFSESAQFARTNSDSSNGGVNDTDGAIFDSVTTTGASTYTMPGAKLRGGFRYLTLFMNSTGWVDVTHVSLNFTAVPLMSNPAAYANYFYSSDTQLNQLWYAGAYTTQMDIITPSQGRQWNGNPGWSNDFTISGGTSVLTDGAKRDRTVWPGDVGLSGSTAYIAIDDTVSLKNALQRMYDSQQTSGELPYGGPPFNLYGSDTYHMWTLVGTYNYYLYSGDTAWLASIWTKYQNGMTFIRNKVNGAHGLLNVTGTNDWARAGQGGENIEANALLYRALVTGSQLATVEGNSSLSTTYANAAATLKANINSALWNAAQGAYRDNPASNLYPQDGNALAVWFDVTDSTAKNTSIAGYLRSNWSTFGSRTPEWNSSSPPGISPFPGSFELVALAKSNADSDVLSLIRREWGYMYNAPGAPKTFWEGLNADGSYGYFAPFTSNAHGWSTGPTVVLTFYTLGIMPTAVKGQQYSVIPHPAELTHCEGQLTVDSGKIVKASYDRANNNAFTMTVDSTTNSGSTGVVAVPRFGVNRTVTINGATVWNGTTFSGSTGIASADQDANYIYFRGVQPGARTFAYTGSQATWQTCANEAGMCTFSGTKGVRYGSGTTFVYGAFTNGVSCANASFGDPTPNVVKHCEVSDTEVPPSPGVWTLCSAENGTCTFSDTKMVAYGSQGKYNMATFSGSVACNNTTFVDPNFGVVKSCYQSTLPQNASFEAPSVTDYSYGPSGGSWAFTPNSGNFGSGVQKTGNSGSFGAAFVPLGAQTAFLQDGASISQTISGMSAGTYAVSVLAAKRGWSGDGRQTFNITVDGSVVGTFSPSSTVFAPFTTNQFSLAAGSHTIAFVGTATSGDNTDFLDSVSILKY